MIRVGLVGCGTIGSRLAATLQRSYAKQARLTALDDINPEAARRLQRQLKGKPVLLPIPMLLRRCDLILETASADAAADLARRVLRVHKSILVMSVGGLLRDERWRSAARRSKGRLYIPSGALAGLDGIRALAREPIRRAELVTTKPPKALADVRYLEEKGIDLSALREPLAVFDGSAREVVSAFPQNTNVAAALTLATGLSGDDVRVRVVADPAAKRNRHAFDVEGDVGRIRCTIESRPSDNPKTSEIAVRSAEATLDRLFASIVIGS